MSFTRNKASLLTCLVLASAALVAPGQFASASAPEPRVARAKITMAKVNGAVTGGTWAVSGKIARAGKAKKIIVEWKAGSPRFPTASARTATVGKAGWAKIGSKKVRGSKYSINFHSDTAGASKIRVRLVSGSGKTLAKSRARTLIIVQNPFQQPTVPPAQPGQNGLKSGLTGQVNYGNPLMGDYMENVWNNIAWYWQANFNAWGYGTVTAGHYWPAPGEQFYDGCSQRYIVNDKEASYCAINDYVIFSQAAAIDMWNGVYAQTASVLPGDFAVAMAMAHEFGHNITWELWPNAHELFSRYQLEAFADCLAGTWTNNAYYQGILEAGDVEEAYAILQSFQTDGTYPSGSERQAYFQYGYDNGSPAWCAEVIL